jgi:pimeloyl-ACP methyl ester carboxylesterase
MRRLHFKIDVTGSARLAGRQELAATAFLPGPLPAGVAPIVMFAVPGGGYSRGYFDVHFDGFAGYSEAEHHAARGIVLVAFDPIGVGDSTTTALEAITFSTLADTYADAVRQVLARIAAGTLDPSLPRLERPFVVGIGQSMGGCVSILAQGRHRVFEGVAPLGYSAIHTVLPLRDAAKLAAVRAQFSFEAGGDARAISVAATSAVIGDFVHPFHWEDVPQAILDADMATGYPLRKINPPFGSATVPPCAVQMMSPGAVRAEAASIDVPVLVGVGERDVCPDPWAEPSAYRASRDVSVFVVPAMAHMHNFAGTRSKLWDRLADWARMLAVARG